MKNWKTTAIGILTGLIMIIPNVIALLDNDTTTTFSLDGIMAGLAAMGIGFFAKDHDVTGTGA